VLAGGLIAMLVANLLLMRRALAPLGRLWFAMRTVDPLRPGRRIDPGARSVEVAELAAAFNDMLDRLEEERRSSARRMQSAQEAERRRLSLELHDDIGQSLTALLLRLEVLSRTATDQQRPLLADVTAATRDCLDRVRGIVKRLRPEALDDRGLAVAISRLCDRVAASGGLQVDVTIDDGLPVLEPDAQLVAFRVAQESLTNVVRHAGAAVVTLELRRSAEGVRLTVTDDGAGMHPGTADGTGIRGMRERALMVGSSLHVSSTSHGTQVVLDVPAEEISQ
jgi:two-component system sensor histidine kinase UhpB